MYQTSILKKKLDLLEKKITESKGVAIIEKQNKNLWETFYNGKKHSFTSLQDAENYLHNINDTIIVIDI